MEAGGQSQPGSSHVTRILLIAYVTFVLSLSHALGIILIQVPRIGALSFSMLFPVLFNPFSFSSPLGLSDL